MAAGWPSTSRRSFAAGRAANAPTSQRAGARQPGPLRTLVRLRDPRAAPGALQERGRLGDSRPLVVRVPLERRVELRRRGLHLDVVGEEHLDVAGYGAARLLLAYRREHAATPGGRREGWLWCGHGPCSLRRGLRLRPWRYGADGNRRHGDCSCVVVHFHISPARAT